MVPDVPVIARLPDVVPDTATVPDVFRGTCYAFVVPDVSDIPSMVQISDAVLDKAVGTVPDMSAALILRDNFSLSICFLASEFSAPSLLALLPHIPPAVAAEA